MKSILIVFLLFVACLSNASNFVPGAMAKDAPKELMHWGKLVGRWSTTEETLAQDGSGWLPSKGADWDFFWAYDGWGIQDNYTSPPLSEAVADESARQRGINLRVFNPKEKKWVLTWLTVASSKPMTITATSTDDSVVMIPDEKTPQGLYSRTTFFDMTDKKFEWKLEYSKDQESWREVYRIHATKKPG